MLTYLPNVAEALAHHRPVVALETTLLAHGLPWPINLETALQAEQAVCQQGAVPATCAVVDGQATVGLTIEQLTYFAQGKGIRKASARDLASAIALGASAATTVAATMRIAHRAGIAVFATGGIGGAHRGTAWQWDISADLSELSRTPVVVVCAGAKSVLDLPKTLEVLETLSVPVLGFGTDEFPAFYLRTVGERVSQRVDTVQQAADLARVHWQWGGAGIVLAQPLSDQHALDPVQFQAALEQAECQLAHEGVKGQAVTPRLLALLAELTHGAL